MSPPLEGIRVVELAGLAPAPFASLLLADYGASVLRIDRPHPLDDKSTPPAPTADLLTRRKTSIAVDLKSSGGVALLESILHHVDVLLDPFRPGVLESLLSSMDSILVKNPRLIVARLTGFRRDGPYAKMAGHDINYLGVSGLLSQLGRANDAPYAPANILADFAGGGLMCAFGILLALLARTTSGKGQVVENNMVDGVSYLGSMMRYARKTIWWDQPRGENVLDGGCPWYDVYKCKDGGFMAVGALEPHFFLKLVKGLDLPEKELLAERLDRKTWPGMRKRFRQRFQERTRKSWEDIFEGADACCTPVLDQQELEESVYEQRLPVHLKSSPGLTVENQEAWTSVGLAPGVGGLDTLDQWLGWKLERHIKIVEGGLVKIDTPNAILGPGVNSISNNLYRAKHYLTPPDFTPTDIKKTYNLTSCFTQLPNRSAIQSNYLGPRFVIVSDAMTVQRYGPPLRDALPLSTHFEKRRPYRSHGFRNKRPSNPSNPQVLHEHRTLGPLGKRMRKAKPTKPTKKFSALGLQDELRRSRCRLEALKVKAYQNKSSPSENLRKVIAKVKKRIRNMSRTERRSQEHEIRKQLLNTTGP
ncbi:MAG: hypothetical protein Q9218_007056, partial [Villophora microphyllina]